MATRKRVREPPCRYIDTPTNAQKLGRGEFTELENVKLLAALMKYGPLDQAKLIQAIPSRNEYQIKQRIAALQKKAQQSLTTIRKQYKNGIVKYETRDKVALDRWLDQVFHLQEKAQIESGVQEELPVRMLARSMSLIAKYEDHPSLEECGGVNLKNVYEFLENMMLGLPSKTLPNADAKFLLEALQRLSAKLDLADLDREKSFMICGRPQWRSKCQKPRTYGNNKDPMDEDKILKFFNSGKYNPFQVPEKWLKKNIPQV